MWEDVSNGESKWRMYICIHYNIISNSLRVGLVLLQIKSMEDGKKKKKNTALVVGKN